MIVSQLQRAKGEIQIMFRKKQMRVTMAISNAIKSYKNQAEVLVKKHLLTDPVIPYASILVGILACKLVYDLTHLLSTLYFKSYVGLNRVQRIEWNNRGISTVHAIYIAAMSLYFVYWSELYVDYRTDSSITFRSSTLSTFTLGVSAGYFIADLGMLIWIYPSLGGIEYIIHHILAGVAVSYAIFSGEGQLYDFMVLISEVTTPEINMRWFLVTIGLKKSRAYIINGFMIFFAWLVARILLFIYMFYHVYLHYDQVHKMHAFGFYLVFIVPFVLAVMNLVWFGKILRGLKKTLSTTQS